LITNQTLKERSDNDFALLERLAFTFLPPNKPFGRQIFEQKLEIPPILYLKTS